VPRGFLSSAQFLDAAMIIALSNKMLALPNAMAAMADALDGAGWLCLPLMEDTGFPAGFGHRPASSVQPFGFCRYPTVYNPLRPTGLCLAATCTSALSEWSRPACYLGPYAVIATCLSQ